MAYEKELSRVATHGFRAERNNPDGTRPTASRFIGFTGTCDLSGTGILTADVGSLTVKIDGTTQTKSVDFTAAADITKVTVAEAVTALTTAAFTGITWSLDTATQRLKGVSASGTYVQVTGALAAALDFGQGISEGGNGLEIIKVFSDRVASINFPKDVTAAQKIQQEGAMGTIDTVNINAKVNGLNPVININDDDYELLELIEGGTFDRTAVSYERPLGDKQTCPQFWLEFFSPLIGKGTKKFGDEKCEEMKTLFSCIGTEGDSNIEAKAYAKYSFNVIATDYTDENGVKHASDKKTQLTKSAFLAMDVENV